MVFTPAKRTKKVNSAKLKIILWLPFMHQNCLYGHRTENTKIATMCNYFNFRKYFWGKIWGETQKINQLFEGISLFDYVFYQREIWLDEMFKMSDLIKCDCDGLFIDFYLNSWNLICSIYHLSDRAQRRVPRQFN